MENRQPFTGRPGTGSFSAALDCFGEEPLFRKQRPIPFRPNGTVPEQPRSRNDHLARLGKGRLGSFRSGAWRSCVRKSAAMTSPGDRPLEHLHQIALAAAGLDRLIDHLSIAQELDLLHAREFAHRAGRDGQDYRGGIDDDLGLGKQSRGGANQDWPDRLRRSTTGSTNPTMDSLARPRPAMAGPPLDTDSHLLFGANLRGLASGIPRETAGDRSSPAKRPAGRPANRPPAPRTAVERRRRMGPARWHRRGPAVAKASSARRMPTTATISSTSRSTDTYFDSATSQIAAFCCNSSTTMAFWSTHLAQSRFDIASFRRASAWTTVGTFSRSSVFSESLGFMPSLAKACSSCASACFTFNSRILGVQSREGVASADRRADVHVDLLDPPRDFGADHGAFVGQKTTLHVDRPRPLGKRRRDDLRLRGGGFGGSFGRLGRRTRGILAPQNRQPE